MNQKVVKKKKAPKSYDAYSTLFEIGNIFSAGDFTAGNVTDRARVAYLFVLVRKLLDCLITDDKETKYKLISFYCNWSMHVDLDRNQIVLSDIESIIADKFNDRNLPSLLTRALGLDAIPDQINKLVTGFIVKIKPPFDQELWTKVKPIFLELISSAPLNGGKDSCIREISVVKLPGVHFGFTNPPILEYVQGFKIILKDTPPGQFITVPIDYEIGS